MASYGGWCHFWAWLNPQDRSRSPVCEGDPGPFAKPHANLGLNHLNPIPEDPCMEYLPTL